jgi:UDP-glucose 4-epimerase
VEKIKVVITGGCGFIGSHIAEYWDSQNAEIHIIDNLRSGYLKNIEHIKNATFHNVSITDREEVFKIMEGVTYVHHLAAMVSVPESVQNPLECVKINVNGLINVLDAAVENKVKKIVHSSSAAVYGDNPESPKDVNMKPMPKSPYGITKLENITFRHIRKILGCILPRYVILMFSAPGRTPKASMRLPSRSL